MSRLVAIVQLNTVHDAREWKKIEPVNVQFTNPTNLFKGCPGELKESDFAFGRNPYPELGEDEVLKSHDLLYLHLYMY